MAPGGGHSGTEGWGQYLQYSLNGAAIRVNNSAYAGRSARSFTREVQTVVDQVVPGDWVVIEFGHNDGGTPASDTKYRADCPGMGNETCPVTYDNQTEIVQTYVTCLANASSIFLSRGAKVILSSPTPDNPWASGNFSWTPTRFAYYSWYTASLLGRPARGIYFVDHGNYAAQAAQNLGKEVTDANYPMDDVHTSPFLADVFARAFVLGLKCGTAGLQDGVVNATARTEGDVFGTCEGVNATLPD